MISRFSLYLTFLAIKTTGVVEVDFVSRLIRTVRVLGGDSPSMLDSGVGWTILKGKKNFRNDTFVRKGLGPVEYYSQKFSI